MTFYLSTCPSCMRTLKGWKPVCIRPLKWSRLTWDRSCLNLIKPSNLPRKEGMDRLSSRLHNRESDQMIEQVFLQVSRRAQSRQLEGHRTRIVVVADRWFKSLRCRREIGRLVASVREYGTILLLHHLRLRHKAYRSHRNCNRRSKRRRNKSKHWHV